MCVLLVESDSHWAGMAANLVGLLLNGLLESFNSCPHAADLQGLWPWLFYQLPKPEQVEGTGFYRLHLLVSTI